MIKSFKQFTNENLTSLVDRYKNQNGIRQENQNPVRIGNKKYELKDVLERWIYYVSDELSSIDKNGNPVKLVSILPISYYDEVDEALGSTEYKYVYQVVPDKFYITLPDTPITTDIVDEEYAKQGIEVQDHSYFETEDDVIYDMNNRFIDDDGGDIKVLPFEQVTKNTPGGWYIDIKK